MALDPLSPPPISQPFLVNGVLNKPWQDWFQGVYQKTGKASSTAPLSVSGTAENITGNLDLASHVTGQLDLLSKVAGRLPSAHAASNLSLNTTNNVTADSIDVDASSCMVRIYGPGGVGTDWNRYEATDTGYITQGPYPATQFSGQAYATTYYVAYDPVAGSYIISSDYRLALPDSYFWVAKVDPNASFGGGGATSGGGGTTGGGYGGSGYGRFL